MERALKQAATWRNYTPKLWSEDMFRYIIVRELEKTKIWGVLAAPEPEDKKPKLYLERSYRGKNEKNKTYHKEIDIVSLNTDLRSSEKKRLATKHNGLAIEVKARKKPSLSWKDWNRKRPQYDHDKDGNKVIKKKVGDIRRVRQYVRKDQGNLSFDLAVAISGGRVTGKEPNELVNNPRGCNVLVGWLDDDDKPVLKWYKEPR